MIFEILGVNFEGKKEIFSYDNSNNVLTKKSSGEVYGFTEKQPPPQSPSVPFSKTSPLKKSKEISILKIQLGLSCNYSCDYCSQRFVERAPETNKHDIDEFMSKLENLSFSEGRGLKIEFWGGEPLVYWKTLVPLVEALNKRFKSWKVKPVFSMITNGSLLNGEINTWLINNCFRISISHDGPAQHVRGPDPLEVPETKDAILALFKALHPIGRISFNSMLHRKNISRTALRKFFIELTGDETVTLGEGGLIDSYDEGGQENSLTTKKEHFEFRKTSFNEFHETGGDVGFPAITERVNGFINSILSQRPADVLGQKCGMDEPTTIALDLRGNVITCQNVSAVQVAPNGELHLGGNIEKFDEITLKSGTHWKNREHCSSCPVLHLCRGSCLFLEGENWDLSCENAYSNNIPLFALALTKLTGYVPVYIAGGDLPAQRKDIWGDMLEHKETRCKKIFPIKVEVLNV